MYFLLYRSASGELVSDCSEPPDPLPRGVTAHDVGDRPDWAAVVWDASTRTLVPRVSRVQRDVVADIVTDSRLASVLALPTTQDLVRSVIEERLGLAGISKEY